METPNFSVGPNESRPPLQRRTPGAHYDDQGGIDRLEQYANDPYDLDRLGPEAIKEIRLLEESLRATTDAQNGNTPDSYR